MCLIDDVIIYGKDWQEHNTRLEVVTERINKAGIMLNADKCRIGRTFLGYIIDAAGIHADPEKTKAIVEMEPPTNVTELRRFLGMVNMFEKFSRHIAVLSQRLRELLSKKSSGTWGLQLDQAFANVKSELMQPTTLSQKQTLIYLLMPPHMDWGQSYSNKQRHKAVHS